MSDWDRYFSLTGTKSPIPGLSLRLLTHSLFTPDSGPSTAEGRVRAPSIQEISRLLLPVAEQSQVPNVYSTPDGAAFKEYVRHNRDVNFQT